MSPRERGGDTMMAWLAVLACCCVLGLTSGAVVVPVTPTLPSENTIYKNVADPTPGVKAEWHVIGSAPMVGIHLVNVPETDDWLFVNRGVSPIPDGQVDYTAGRLRLQLTSNQTHSLTSGTWTNTSRMADNGFCGVTLQTSDKGIMMAGGHSKTFTKSGAVSLPRGHVWIRKYIASSMTWPQQVLMPVGRWYPAAALMVNKKVLILGGTDKTTEGNTSKAVATFEIWNPDQPTVKAVIKPVDPVHLSLVKKFYYPFTYVLPTGDVFVLIDRVSRILTFNGDYLKTSTGAFVQAPDVPDDWDTGFPRTGTSALGPLSHTDGYNAADVMVFGGQKKDYLCEFDPIASRTSIAGRTSYRMKITPPNVAASKEYEFSAWETEDMGIPRMGGTALLLPNGDVVISGGAQTGCHGGVSPGQVNKANWPNLWPVLYQTDKAAAPRYTIMKPSKIPRIYHHASGLTRNGELLMTGCDACNYRNLNATMPVDSKKTFYSPSGNRFEYRIEVLKTPYSLDIDNKPFIEQLNGADQPALNVGYGESFTITWTGARPTGVSLVAPSSETHGSNNNQRVVFLEIIERNDDAQTLMVRTPTKIGAAPPQSYMLFLLNGKTHGQARWVHLNY